MPIYEFKCLKCNEFFELLVMNNDEETELVCPKCKSEKFERVISSTSYVMGNSSGQESKATVESKKCSSGSCTSYNIPGPA